MENHYLIFHANKYCDAPIHRKWNNDDRTDKVNGDKPNGRGKKIQQQQLTKQTINMNTNQFLNETSEM